MIGRSFVTAELREPTVLDRYLHRYNFVHTRLNYTIRSKLRREHYLGRLHRFLDAPVITAVVGLRRVGKSVLLRQFAESLREQRQVVYVDRESLEFDQVRSARDLVDFVDATTRRDRKRVVIVDEVQQIHEWERAVASLNGEDHTQVVISGSNARMLASELATLIAGRYVTLQVFPLTLREFEELYRLRAGQTPRVAELFGRYLRIGGLPGLLHTDLSDIVIEQMLTDIVSTILIRDVVRRHRIRDVALFEAIAQFAVDSVGSLVSAKRIADFIRTQGRSTAVDTVYLELRRRGYEVRVGQAGAREIDFVAEGPAGRHYIQVAYLLETRATIDRELNALRAITDAYPRTLLTLDPHQPADFQGVIHQSIVDFLRGSPLGGGRG